MASLKPLTADSFGPGGPLAGVPVFIPWAEFSRCVARIVSSSSDKFLEQHASEIEEFHVKLAVATSTVKELHLTRVFKFLASACAKLEDHLKGNGSAQKPDDEAPDLEVRKKVWLDSMARTLHFESEALVFVLIGSEPHI